MDSEAEGFEELTEGLRAHLGFKELIKGLKDSLRV